MPNLLKNKVLMLRYPQESFPSHKEHAVEEASRRSAFAGLTISRRSTANTALGQRKKRFLFGIKPSKL